MQLALCVLGGAVSAAAEYTFLAVGDWGNDNSGQYADAKGMETVAEEINAAFVLLLGDNFYADGIQGTDKSSRFETTFEDVYNGTALEAIDYYVIAGNHDWKGNWMQPPGARDAGLALEQWEWLSATLNASTADYLWVGGHYPVWSACSHGPTFELVETLRPQLEAVGAHYMSGHDHCLGHIDDGTGVQYIVAGNGMECCYDPTNADKNPDESIKFFAAGPGGSTYEPMPFTLKSGFASFHVTSDNMRVDLHAHNGTVLYSTPNITPRSAAQKAKIADPAASALA
ncbi:hypothetical protein CTAYLR_001798 [Chrysophaeum taylorii]|uniref:Calcineurin-like phosphoesterase domain-containing protein n=1 Tax=Chrysophaeum taylorii TaxID=2483200 RepID=A0AAD7XPU2_9STRA|nr:hypothetical protein CTAYLR_001798 [Chrysophaeum taylorii]